MNDLESDAHILRHVQPIFDNAPFAKHLGIRLEAAGPGWCRTSLAVQDCHLQQHGIVHAGVITTLADHTTGGAARASVPPGSDVVTVEFKMNFLRPVTVRRLSCKGWTLRAGSRIIVTTSEVYMLGEGEPVLAATCSATLSVITPR